MMNMYVVINVVDWNGGVTNASDLQPLTCGEHHHQQPHWCGLEG